MKFDYLYIAQSEGSIDIEDVGNVCISATNTLFQEYFLVIQTMYGRTKIIQYGPVFVDIDDVPSFVSYTYTEIDYSQGKISNIIEKFLNNPKYNISQVTLIELEDARERITDLMEFLNDT